MGELVLQVEHLHVLVVEHVFVLDDHHSEVLTPGPHFSLTELHNIPAEILHALVQIFRRNYHSRATSQSLNFQTSILELSKHFLHRSYLVDDVEVVLLILGEFESTSELLPRINEDFHSFAIHFEGSREGCGLALYHRLSLEDHIVHNLSLVNFHFTAHLVEGLHS